MKKNYIALVLGLSANGLSIARALNRNGIDVHAFEQNDKRPAIRTNSATVHIVDEMYAGGLVSCLLTNRSRFEQDYEVVLFPTSDKMVRELGENWRLLSEYYVLSWSDCISTVLKLLDKDSLEDICQEKSIPYPKSVICNVVLAPESIKGELCFPVIIKPVRPLSAFKAIHIEEFLQIQNVLTNYESDLPFVVQEYIDGDEADLFFHTMFVDNGKVLAEFTGRKLQSIPASLGIGTILESANNSEVRDLARRFIDDDFTGPIAIEIKKNSSGDYYLIEPNIGRTEISVDLVIQAGVNMPLIEFFVATNNREKISLQESEPTIWFDTERDPLSYFQFCIKYKSLWPMSKKPVFLYYGHNDLKPLMGAIMLMIKRILRKLRKLHTAGR
jgi:predicted ATP-grasp superfamily ATP-dependent carboligase